MSALGWHRVGDGRYRAVTGRRTYIIQRQDFSGIWKVSGNANRLGFGHTLREAKGIAQSREDRS